MIKLVTAVAALCAVISCMTPEKYTKQLYTEWYGKHIDDAVMAYGASHTVSNLQQGRKMYEWVRVGGTTATGSVYGNTAIVNSNTSSCSIRLTTDEASIIRAVNWQGACADFY